MNIHELLKTLQLFDGVNEVYVGDMVVHGVQYRDDTHTSVELMLKEASPFTTVPWDEWKPDRILTSAPCTACKIYLNALRPQMWNGKTQYMCMSCYEEQVAQMWRNS